MPRKARTALGGIIYHVLNRANAGARIFNQESDFRAFEHVVTETAQRIPMRILAYCIMPNHWHMILWPEQDGTLGTFMQRLTTTHVRRWHVYRDSVGSGHLYQGTYKSFPVQDDVHFLIVCRYVERNALRAGLVERAQDWPWGSLALRSQRGLDPDRPVLSPWPVERPRRWTIQVNEPLTHQELEAVRTSLVRGRPLGQQPWQQRTAQRLGLQSTFRNRGRPRAPKPR